MKELDQKIKSIYTSKFLTAEELALIKAKKPIQQKVFSVGKQTMKYAAVLAFISASVLILVLGIQNHRYNVSYDYAKEVAFNHEKELASDFESNDIQALDEQMTKLDFDMVLPDQISSNYTLNGARYCSINFNIAAQLKIQDQNGSISTFYIFKKTEGFSINRTITFQKTRVRLWDDETLVYAIASDL